jgi:hypothetical protein
VPNGYLGPISHLNARFTNFGDLEVAGFNFDAHCTLQTEAGQITPSLSVTQTYKYTSALSHSSPAASKVSQADANGFAPRWKGIASVGWKRGPYAVNASGRFVSGYNDYLGFPFTYPHGLGNFWVWDANSRYTFGEALGPRSKWLTGAYVEVGAINVFDREPQASCNIAAFDYQQADLRGRFLHGSLGVKW